MHIAQDRQSCGLAAVHLIHIVKVQGGSGAIVRVDDRQPNRRCGSFHLIPIRLSRAAWVEIGGNGDGLYNGRIAAPEIMLVRTGRAKPADLTRVEITDEEVIAAFARTVT